jgi:hypothetical protein
MIAGILHQAGYFMGHNLYPAHKSNPKGFFEWREINQINEKILSQYGKGFFSRSIKFFLKKYSVFNPGEYQRWLLVLKSDIDVSDLDPMLEKRIKKVVSKTPYCYKDPRFSYSLPVWKPFLKPDTLFICIFREPNVTIQSILTECKERPYLSDLFITKKAAYLVWESVYTHILDKNQDIMDRFFFVHYNQIYNKTVFSQLSDFLQTPLDDKFVDKNLKRSFSEEPYSKKVRIIYRRLCEMANYKDI